MLINRLKEMLTNDRKRILAVGLVFFVLLVFNRSCKSRLNFNDLRWNPYRDNRTIFFKSDKGNTDSLNIYSKIITWEKDNRDWLGHGFWKDTEFLEVYADKKVFHNVYFLRIAKSSNTNKISLSIYFKGYVGFFITQNKALKTNEYFEHELLIKDSSTFILENKKIIPNCYKLTNYREENRRLSDSKEIDNKKIRYLYWNIEKGLVGYEHYDGEIYRLVGVFELEEDSVR